MTHLRACYPSMIRIDEEVWKTTLRVYFSRLERFDARAVQKAIAKAPVHHREFMPTSGQLEVLCQFYERNVASQDAVSGLEPKQLKAPENLGKAASAFEYLALKWEQESKELGLRKDEPTPPELHDRRMTEFWEYWRRYA